MIPLTVNEILAQAKDTQVNNDISYLSVSQEKQEEKDNLDILSKCVFWDRLKVPDSFHDEI